LPKELIEIEKTNYAEAGSEQPSQSVEEIMRIIQEAKMPGEGSKAGLRAAAGASDSDDVEADIESEVDVSGDYVSAV
jgi:serine/threonine-protein kinase SRK2